MLIYFRIYFIKIQVLQQLFQCRFDWQQLLLTPLRRILNRNKIRKPMTHHKMIYSFNIKMIQLFYQTFYDITHLQKNSILLRLKMVVSCSGGVPLKTKQTLFLQLKSVLDYICYRFQQNNIIIMLISIKKFTLMQF